MHSTEQSNKYIVMTKAKQYVLRRPHLEHFSLIAYGIFELHILV